MRCDFSGSVAAGAKLTEMLNLGASVPWPQALKVDLVGYIQGAYAIFS